MMAKYKKRQVAIDAFQFDGDFVDRDGNVYVPCWAMEALDNRDMFFDKSELFVRAYERLYRVEVGDYVIRDAGGNPPVCKPGLFERTYEEVE